MEVLQLLNALSGKSKGWTNHPACRMWRGWEHSLVAYGMIVCQEWTGRGFRDSCLLKIAGFLGAGSPFVLRSNGIWCPCDRAAHPPWYREEFILAHRSNLIRKMPDFYQPKWPDVPANLPYVWPVKKEI